MTVPALLVALLVKPALVLTAAAAMILVLRRRAAAARHAVWAGAIVATLALPALSIALPPLRIATLSESLTRSGDAGSAADVAAPSGVSAAAPARDPRHPGGFAVRGAGERFVGALLAVWIAGVVLAGGRRIAADVRLRRLVRRGRPVLDPRRARLFSDVVRSWRIRRPVDLRLSDETASPGVAGVLRPVVLLPADADTWTEAEFRAVAVHELAHVVRHDCLFNILGDVARAVYWCHPLVHLAVRRMQAESERACDDRVLKDGAEPEDYAHFLLRIAHAAHGNRAFHTAVTAMARPRELESRLLAVLDGRRPRRPLRRWMSVTLAGVGIVFALPSAALTVGPAPLVPFQLVGTNYALLPDVRSSYARASRNSAETVGTALTNTQPAAPEPDRLADSVAGPMSERVPLAPEVHRTSRGAMQALAGPDSGLVRRLVAAAEHRPEHDGDLVRERAAWALAQVRDGRLVEPLLEALEARDWRIQAYAAWALATARAPRAVPRLIPLLDHPVWRLRAMAAYALRESRDPRARAAMNAALTDPAWQVRVEAVEYFAALGGPALRETLRPRLDDRHVAVRRAAERALTSH